MCCSFFLPVNGIETRSQVSKYARRIKSSQADSWVRWFKHTRVSETNFVSIFRVLRYYSALSLSCLCIRTGTWLIVGCKPTGVSGQSENYCVWLHFSLSVFWTCWSLGCQLLLSINPPSLLIYKQCFLFLQFLPKPCVMVYQFMLLTVCHCLTPVTL
jgi:hypothetical protein